MGSGKSTVGRLLAARGATVIDADDLAREVTAPGTAGHQAVVARFGRGVVGPDGALDRRALAALVFGDPAELAALEAITHPLVGRELQRRLQEGTGQGMVVIEVPLLDQGRRAQYGMDVVVLVDTDSEVAAERASGRGLSADDVRARQRAQPSWAERASLADRVITNNAGLSQLAAAVDELWVWLAERAAARPP